MRSKTDTVFKSTAPKRPGANRFSNAWPAPASAGPPDSCVLGRCFHGPSNAAIPGLSKQSEGPTHRRFKTARAGPCLRGQARPPAWSRCRSKYKSAAIDNHHPRCVRVPFMNIVSDIMISHGRCLSRPAKPFDEFFSAGLLEGLQRWASSGLQQAARG